MKSFFLIMLDFFIKLVILFVPSRWHSYEPGQIRKKAALSLESMCGGFCLSLNNMTPQEYLSLAYKEALQAKEENETPVGAIIVYQNTIIASGHNLSQDQTNPLLHAEIVALTKAFEVLKTKNLSQCQIYISLEPCLMCLGAIINSHIKDIYFSALDLKKGAFTHYGVQPSIDKIEIHYIKDQASEKLLSDFFKSIR